MKLAASASYTLVYDGKEDPATKQVYITSFNNAALAAGTYNFVVRAFNWVGKSPDSTALTIILPTKVSKTAT